MMICLEGIDAAGKATHSKLLAGRLTAELISFPDYSTETGKLIKGHLLEQWWIDALDLDPMAIDPMVFQCIMLANKIEAVTRIEVARAQGSVVLDRYWPSALAYGLADGLDRDWLMNIHRRLPQPDLFLLLDVDPSDSLKRRPARRDRYEKDHERMHAIARNYRDLWAERRMVEPARWVVINARGSKEETADLINKACDEAA